MGKRFRKKVKNANLFSSKGCTILKICIMLSSKQMIYVQGNEQMVTE